MNKTPEKVPVNIIDKSSYYIVRQPQGGPTFSFGTYAEVVGAKLTTLQSEANCGKQLAGLGFNPNSREELEGIIRECKRYEEK